MAAAGSRDKRSPVVHGAWQVPAQHADGSTAATNLQCLPVGCNMILTNHQTAQHIHAKLWPSMLCWPALTSDAEPRFV